MSPNWKKRDWINRILPWWIGAREAVVEGVYEATWTVYWQDTLSQIAWVKEHIEAIRLLKLNNWNNKETEAQIQKHVDAVIWLIDFKN